MRINIPDTLARELPRTLRNGHFEPNEQGIYLPRQKAVIGGTFIHDVYRPGVGFLGEQCDHNLVVNEGLNALLDIMFHADTQITTWYVGIFEGNYTPVATDTAANIASNSTESTAYDEASRQEYNEAAASGQSITNSANKATFTINATKTIYGAFLISNSTKGGTSGTLFSASRFSASRSVIALDSLLITYTITAADA